MIVHRGQVLPKRVDLHRILWVARSAENAKSNYVVVHEVPERFLFIGEHRRLRIVLLLFCFIRLHLDCQLRLWLLCRYEQRAAVALRLYDAVLWFCHLDAAMINCLGLWMHALMAHYPVFLCEVKSILNLGVRWRIRFIIIGRHSC